jgi:hypothetical protein
MKNKILTEEEKRRINRREAIGVHEGACYIKDYRLYFSNLPEDVSKEIKRLSKVAKNISFER